MSSAFEFGAIAQSVPAADYNNNLKQINGDDGVAVYDEEGKMTSYAVPDGYTWTFTYDEYGDLATVSNNRPTPKTDLWTISRNLDRTIATIIHTQS